MRLFIGLFTALIVGTTTQAQQKSDWGLQDCIQYALSHNISIKQDSLNATAAKLTLRQSEYSQIPSVNVSGNYGKSFGRSINPATNQFVEGNYDYVSMSGSANALLFSGLQVRNNIQKNRYALKASMADLDQLKSDVSVNVANAYLAALLAREQVKIAKNQISLSNVQLIQTQAFADAGRLPELNVAQLQSQVASDSSNYISAIANYNAALLDLKSLLNIDFSQPFDIESPGIEPGDAVNTISGINAEDIFNHALQNFGSVKGANYRVLSAQKGLTAAKGGLSPQLSLGYQFGTNYSGNYQTYTYRTDAQYYQINGVRDSLNHINEFYYSPISIPVASQMKFNDQFNNNLRHSLYLNLNIPIFNSWQTNYQIKQARVSLQSQELAKQNTELTLRQNVYKAYNNALSAVQKYNAAKRAEEAAKRALEFAKKRYDLGLTTTVDLLVTQNSMFSASSNLIIAKYDLIFKLKVIDYYSGKELKL